MPMKRVLDARGCGNIVIADYKKGSRYQQFVFDEKSKTIRGLCSNSRSLEIQNNGRAFNVRLSNTNSRWW